MEQKIDTPEKLNDFLKESSAALVYFYSDNCSPCLQLRPKVKELIEGDFPEMKLLLINAEEYREIAANYMAFSYPVILLFFDGKEFSRFSKNVSISELKSTIGRVYGIYYG
jgi:thioredoxin-like negative regulator of GroEL